MAIIRGKMPEFTESTLPKGLYKQQAADQKTLGLYNFAIASKDTLPAGLPVRVEFAE